MQYESLNIILIQRFNELMSSMAKLGMTPLNYVLNGFRKGAILNVFKQTNMPDFAEDKIKIILVSREDPEFKCLYGCLLEFHQEKLNQAPFLGIALAKINQENIDTEVAHKNADRLVRTYLTECAINGLNSNVLLHNVAGFYNDKLSKCLHIPKDFMAISMFAIGTQNIETVQNDDANEHLEEYENYNELIMKPIWNI